jgi:rRNA maturation protein Nop10
MTAIVTFRCDECGDETRNPVENGWKESDEGDDYCPPCFRKLEEAAPPAAGPEAG